MKIIFPSRSQFHLLASSIPRLLYRLILTFVISFALSACAIKGDWQTRAQQEDVTVQLREHPGSALPEFKAEVEINGSVQQVMMVLTDFSRYPEWVYQCESIRIIDTLSYTEAYLYQVNGLPFISDRDLIMHGQVFASDSGDEVRIELNSAPNYCESKSSSVCAAANDSPYVRVRDTQGSLLITRLESRRVRVTWQHYVDPAGAVPAWLTRLMIKQVPLQSLQELKRLVEAEQNSAQIEEINQEQGRTG